MPGLARILAERGWTVAELAAVLEVSPSRAHQYLQPVPRFAPATVQRVAESLGVSVGELTGRP